VVEYYNGTPFRGPNEGADRCHESQTSAHLIRRCHHFPRSSIPELHCI
jgi:hypothetical protein